MVFNLHKNSEKSKAQNLGGKVIFGYSLTSFTPILENPEFSTITYIQCFKKLMVFHLLAMKPENLNRVSQKMFT